MGVELRPEVSVAVRAMARIDERKAGKETLIIEVRIEVRIEMRVKVRIAVRIAEKIGVTTAAPQQYRKWWRSR
jgi:hypothetical protein